MQRFSQWLLRLLRWKIIGELPDKKKYIIAVAPHTSNWDLMFGLLMRSALGVKVQFLAKHQLFVFPLSWILKAIGGMPVNRDKHAHLVDAIVELFDERDALVFGVAPEGTRSAVTRWKQGFYHIACQAKVPIVLLGMDYSTKQFRLSEPFSPSGNIEQDFPKILDYFRDIKGRYPQDIPEFMPSNGEPR